jgi:excisionase family DNA binding protein
MEIIGKQLPNNYKAGLVAAQIDAHPTLIPAKTLATYLDVSTKSIYAWVKSGTLPALRFGVTIRFDPATTAKWVRAHSA